MSPFPLLLSIQHPSAAVTPPTGPIVWLKTPIVGLVQDDSVTTWPDSSGNGNDATGVNTPRYQTTTTFNSLHTVACDSGLPEYFTIAVDASAWSEATVAIVLKVDADPPGGGGNGLWTLSDADFNAHFPYTDGVIYDNAFSTVRKTVGNPTPSLTSEHHYIVTSKASEWTAYLDGTSLHSTGTNTFDGRNGFEFMRSSTSGSVGVTGFVSELLIYDSVLAGADLTQLIAYLDDRYAL
jgi:hypothetical protein